METITKRLLAIAILVSMAVSYTVSAQAAVTGKYWLAGVSKKAGGQMRMYYGENHAGTVTITLKGKMKKSKSQNTVYGAKEKKRSLTLKVADNCKVVFIESTEPETVDFKEWAQWHAYENGGEISFIASEVLVKDKKISRICFSA